MKKNNRKNSKNKQMYRFILVLLIMLVSLITNRVSSQVEYNNINTNEELNIINDKEDFNKLNKENEDIINKEDKAFLEIYYFDVGQGDSILIKCKNESMLIDAGTNGKGEYLVEKIKEIGINRIDYLVGTHPHEDHIGGLDDIIDNFEIGKIFLPKVRTNTKTFEDVLDSVKNKKLKIKSPKEGEEIYLNTAKCTIKHCGTGTEEEKENLNLASIIIEIKYGNRKFLFTGDAEYENEKNIDWNKIDVLKVAHHGSNTSTSMEFLNKVKPQISIISCGRDNKYGHPQKETLDRLNKINSKIYRTDINGTIYLKCDGNIIDIKTEK